MADEREKRWKDELGDVHAESEIDPRTGLWRNTYILPAGPPAPPPPEGPTFLQRHPYFGPIIGAIIGALITGSIALYIAFHFKDR
ncbi:MAG: hypothetical protein ACJ8C4_16335 [Gemmataceae bacterium]